MNEVNILEVLHETAYAEQGSALEMLAACKHASKNTFAFGYFEHAKDEYKHAKIFLEILAKKTRNFPVEFSKQYRFTPLGLLSKGYISKSGFLIERLNLKDFIAFVYTNELLAKESFSKISQLLASNIDEQKLISLIMLDELRHHEMAKNHFLKYYPNLQPFHLLLYRIREIIKNKSRKLYHQNLLFLEKIFYPLYRLIAYGAVPLLRLISIAEFNRTNVNLMSISSKGLL
ncbi:MULTISPECIES: hypothetical protein [Prochlorococcus]|uniref:hypothetical protein n=1 Tax=Prochlorococcus TaxID=1218 RepID=UPI000533A215|nr:MULTISPECIES: hypothetical protein [Prochlorococcus]KGG11889.1 hypothetical protein EV05_1090 [Prochlorococcus sp. MIT 0601]